MLGLQLPNLMPHAVPRDRSLDFYSSHPMPKLDSQRQMQLPVPRITNGHELDALRAASRLPLTPPTDLPGSAVRVVAFQPTEGASRQYGYQLPAIGNSRTLSNPQMSPSPAQRQPLPPTQPDAMSAQQQQNQQQRKKWSISPNLRVPSTIKTPQEGLPQLAAEVSGIPRLLCF